jgi:hypothetical protein
MRRVILGLLTVVSPLLLASCDTNSPTAATVPPDASASGVRAVAPGTAAVLSGQSLHDIALGALEHGTPPGAVLNTDVGCFVLAGFYDQDGTLVAFGLLFGEAGTFGTCGPGSFDRTDPDGSIDQFLHARGSFYLSVVDPSANFPSDGSDVKWTRIVRADGVSVFDINGTLSDGSHVRAHFTSGTPGPNQSSSLWVEGLGYVLSGSN